MEEAARKRREKLQALKKGNLTAYKEQQKDDDSSDSREKQTLKRSMDDDPEDLTKNGESDENVKTVENMAQSIQEEIKKKAEEIRHEEVDLSTLVPKKVDWDLKRDIQPKLDKLERQTTRKVVELIRQRIADGDQLVDSVRADRLNSAAANGRAPEDSDSD